MAQPTSKKKTKEDVGLTYGFRSGLEERIASELTKLNISYTYEEKVIAFVQPEMKRKYTPDFVLPNGIIIETKGRLVLEDRKKHLLVQQQHPTLDIRFVFSNSRQRISKTSQTTYADWCLKYDIPFANKSIPISWLKEPKKT